MNACTPSPDTAGLLPLSAMFFEAPRRTVERRPRASLGAEKPSTPEPDKTGEERQAARFAFAVGTVALVLWGALLVALATHLHPPTLL